MQNNGFVSSERKRTILVVEDELINRELLENVLQQEFEVLSASDGEEGLRLIRQLKNALSLVLLDLNMPVMSGTELLRRLKEDAETARIPVIVLTADQSAEINSLELGAVDFIPKPYPLPGVILARVRRTIELYEDRDTIRSTERDPVTGLYNREYFYLYAAQYDRFHPDAVMDALVLDVFRFRLINERFGTEFGNVILRRIAGQIQQTLHAVGGIACRSEADTFLAYCPHRDDYERLLSQTALTFDAEGSQMKVLLRVGIYAEADRALDLERRFDRARAAADTVRGSVTRTVARYDRALHEKEIYEEQLVEDFHRAVREEQFKVYYQPKYSIQGDAPVLSSAEALVRWAHPKLGMISPGVFIPLFEENGLIQELDMYVWEHAAAQIRDWKDRLGSAAPVSVNVSRIDLYDPGLVGVLRGLLEKYSLTPEDLLLEVTESAYAGNAGQIIEAVRQLRAAGFRIEMDDFGSGYSSLNMVSAMPLDALKLDMQFIRTAFTGSGDTWMLRIMIEISGHLKVPVIAEGVETAEQAAALKELGCDIIQGYYFSRPVPAEEFECFLLNRVWKKEG